MSRQFTWNMETERHDQHRCQEPEARWANQFRTGFREHVIELVFFQNTSDSEKRIIARIITSPDDAKEFVVNLQETIDRYEKEYGIISNAG